MSAAAVAAWPRFSVGLEEGPEGSTHVHALTLPGCMATGPTTEAAIGAFETVLADWLRYLASQGEPVPPPDRELEIVVEEWIATDADIEGGQSNVCFAADRVPLTEAELTRGLQLLGGLRGRLVPLIRRARNTDLEQLGSPDLNARIILDELARAQWWTLTRLGASPLAEVPERVVARLDTAMALVVQHLGHLPAGARGATVELDGEEWTPRKVWRRLLWLEWTLGAAALHAIAAAEPIGG